MSPASSRVDPQQIALQILSLLRDETILAAVFRRVFDGDQTKTLDRIVENMIQADADRNSTALGHAYKRLKPTALTFWREGVDQHGNLKLLRKQPPCAPTAEELTPNAMVVA